MLQSTEPAKGLAYNIEIFRLRLRMTIPVNGYTLVASV